jgi:hypothetical protein
MFRVLVMLDVRRRVISFFLVFLAVVGWPSPSKSAEPATITFSLDFPDSDPAHYSITVRLDGHAKYECRGKTSPDSDEQESYQSEFDFSPATRAQIFNLAAQAHYFAGKIDSGNSKLAFTGSKKLTYQDGRRSNVAEYNYSNQPAVEQLTQLFQDVAATLEYGRRLAYYHHYQKLALDEELKRMEGQAKNKELAEIQAVQPVLQEILADASVINVVRARAQRLIEMGKSAALPGH